MEGNLRSDLCDCRGDAPRPTER